MREKLCFILVFLGYQELLKKCRQELAGVQVLPEEGIVAANNHGTSKPKHMLRMCGLILVLILA